MSADFVDSDEGLLADLDVPSVLCGRYEVMGLLQTGTSAHVLRTEDMQRSTNVVIKIFHGDRLAAFRREVAAGFELSHPLIVSPIDTFILEDGRAAMVQPYFRQGSLDVMLSRGPVGEATAIHCLEDLLEALTCLHERRWLHSDLKPGNVLLDTGDPSRSSGLRFLLADLGSATPFKEGLERLNVPGSPAYTAPERLFDAYGPESDLYSIGVMAFELLTGYLPFSGTVDEIHRAHLSRKPALTEIRHDGLASWVGTLLEKEPSRRPASAREALRLLKGVTAPASVRHGATSPEGQAQWCPQAFAQPKATTLVPPVHPPSGEARRLHSFVLDGEPELLQLIPLGHADTRAVVVGYDKHLQCFDLHTGTPVSQMVMFSGACAPAADGRLLIHAAGRVSFYDVLTGQRTSINQCDDKVLACAVAGDAAVSAARTAPPSVPPALCVWRDRRTVFALGGAIEQVKALRAQHYGMVPHVAANSRYALFSGGLASNVVSIWEPSQPVALAQWDLNGPVVALSAATDAALVATQAWSATRSPGRTLTCHRLALSHADPQPTDATATPPAALSQRDFHDVACVASGPAGSVFFIDTQHRGWVVNANLELAPLGNIGSGARRIAVDASQRVMAALVPEPTDGSGGRRPGGAGSRIEIYQL